MLPYRLLNADVQQRLGGHHSARLLLYSIDYHAIKSRYHDGWAEIPNLLKQEIQTLLSFKPDCWILANNTLHRAYELVRSELPADPPFFHAVELVRDELIRLGLRKVLLIGTQFTMEDGFFARPIEAAGIRVDVPSQKDREVIQAMQTRLSKGECDSTFASAFKSIFERHEAEGCEAVITACTELPLVVRQEATSMRLVDPLVLQCRRCVDFVLADPGCTPLTGESRDPRL
jgi:aspartate racemase